MATAAVIEGAQTVITFDELFQTEYPRLARALFLLTGDREEADDLAQEAMARVFERWARVASMDSPVGYAYRTALNLQRKRVRRLAIWRRLQPFDRSAGVRDPLAAARRRSEVGEMLATLPPKLREALVLVEWLGMSPEETGSALGIEAVSARVRVHRAKAALRERFGGEAFDDD